MNKILAFDLSTQRGSLAWRAGDHAQEWDWPNDRQNSGQFFQHLSEVQQRFGLPDTIIVGIGPGSYAGTRIAISAAIGLQVATGAQLIGHASICALPETAPEYCVVGDARRQSFFLAIIKERAIVGSPELIAAGDLAGRVDALRGRMPILTSDPLPPVAGVAIEFPSAAILARLAPEWNHTFVLPPLEPLYLRGPHITIPRTKLPV